MLGMQRKDAGNDRLLVEHDLRAKDAGEFSIEQCSYRGWTECYRLTNGLVEAIVVPAAGRLMQLRLQGDSEGSLWENPALDGGRRDAAPGEWRNFGGDKCWPSPQSNWARQQGHSWPPPRGFDGLPMQALVSGEWLELRAAVDDAWGVEVRRRMQLVAGMPVLKVRTEYRKLTDSPVTIGVWTISQFREPELVCAKLNPKSRFSGGYTHLLEDEPEQLQCHSLEDGARMLTLARHREAFTKVGLDGTSLLWIGASSTVRMDIESVPGEYPDGGCATEIYTNPGPMDYVELEMLGPMTEMNPGDTIHQVVTYTVMPRTRVDAVAEAKAIFAGLRD